MNTTTDYKVWNNQSMFSQGSLSPKAQPNAEDVEKIKNENWKDIIKRLNKKYSA